jgi:hypothetical protein
MHARVNAFLSVFSLCAFCHGISCGSALVVLSVILGLPLFLAISNTIFKATRDAERDVL